MQNNKQIIPVILSGGTGSRLWPLSRASYPKQYICLSENTSKSMLQLTVDRLCDLENINNPIVICNEDHRFIMAEQLREININPKAILLEPFGRNTAPAIAIAAIKAMEEGHDPNLLILPADHEIKKYKNFLDAIRLGSKSLETRLVTFGIVPTSAETGYGYIKSSPKMTGDGEFLIEKFIEKPKKELAQELIKDKQYTWNSGMFLFKSSLILNELKKYYPEIIEICKKSIEQKNIDLDFQRINQNYFKNCPNISIDKAVMEKKKLVL